MALELPHCRVDLDRRVVRLADGSDVRLTAKEAALLRFLAARAGRTVSREELHSAVWGHAPSVISRAADDTVRRLRPKIEADPSDPVVVITVHGEGYRFVPPEAPADAVADPEPFFGREETLAAVQQALVPGHLVTLCGPGGVGKTRLAGRIAALARQDGSSTLLVDCSGARDETGLVDAVASAAGIASGTADGGAAALGRWLAQRGPDLLVLDNLEQVAEGAGRVIAGWIGDLKLLATSRVGLGIRGERCIELPPLTMESALALFEHRARSLSDRFEIGGDRALAEAVVDAVDRLPLAVELVACRAARLPLAEVKARLAGRTGRLRHWQRDVPERQQTMAAAVDWSWQLLTDEERRVLAACTAFRGWFDLDDAEAVVDADVDEVLLRLCDQALVRVDRSGLQARFALYRVVADHAAPHLDGPFWERHAERFLARGDDVWRRFLDSERMSDLAAIEAIEGELRAAAERFGGEQAARAALYLSPLVLTRGRFAVLEGQLRDAVRAGLPPDLRAAALRVHGESLRLLDRLEEAREVLEEAAAVLGALGHERLAGIARCDLARVHSDARRPDDAAAMVREARASAARCGDERLLARVALTDAWLQIRAQRFEEAVRLAEEAAPLCARHGLERLSVAEALVRGVALERLTRVATSVAVFERAAAEAGALGDVVNEAYATYRLGVGLLIEHRLEEAARRLEASIALNEVVGQEGNVGMAALELATCRERSGDSAGADAAIQQAARALARDPGQAGLVLYSRAMLLLIRGEPAAAGAMAERALEALSASHPPTRHYSTWIVGRTRHELGDVDGARATFEALLAQLEAAPYATDLIGLTLLSLALVEREAGRPEPAWRLCEHAVNAALSTELRRACSAHLAEVRHACGDPDGALAVLPAAGVALDPQPGEVVRLCRARIEGRPLQPSQDPARWEMVRVSLRVLRATQA